MIQLNETVEAALCFGFRARITAHETLGYDHVADVVSWD